jgi:outer membrane protein TolC
MTFGKWRMVGLSLWMLRAGARVACAQGGDTNQTTAAPQPAMNLASGGETNSPLWLSHPMSLADALNLALQQNGSILRGKSDLQAQYGIVVQTRAVALPKLAANGNYQHTTEVETFSFGGFNPITINDTWAANIELTQTIYQGGQLTSALRSAKYTREQALLNYQTTIADALLQVRIAYFDVLSAAEQITVEEASVNLLTQQLDDQTKRNQAGTVPRFNVLQAEVELANEQPKLIQARNTFRVAKNNLVNQLGFRLPPAVLEDVPIELSDKLDSNPYQVDLPGAIAEALRGRTELLSLRKQQQLAREAVISARAGYKPTAQIFGEYGGRNAEFVSTDPGWTVHGWTAGATVTWNIFDGLLTQGKIEQAKAQQTGTKVDLDNEERTIELEVRTDYSDFLEASEVVESQKKVQEEAEEALRLARARNDAGTGTQLDVLSAQTSLRQAHSTQVQALHDYDVARARLERAIGVHVTETNAK